MNDKTRIELETLITEREGMIAKNLQRRSQGQVMAYVQENFNSLANRIRNLLEEKAPYHHDTIYRTLTGRVSRRGT